MATPAGNQQDADLILMNAKIATHDTRRSTASATAIKDGRFIAVGSDKIASPSRVDCK